jgi:putative membrane protein
MIKKYLIILLKGIAMGMADVVPGVSGGTIAFISGIYEEFVNSLNSINGKAIKLLFHFKLKEFWNHINGTFLLSLATGILISIISLSKLIIYLLENEPVLLWAFFFGLILASVLFIGKQISQWNTRVIIALIIGIGVSFYVTIMEPTSSPDSSLYIFLSGFIAIIAMILPGISGAFILLLLGAYPTIIGAINNLRTGLTQSNFDLIITSGEMLGIFAIGAVLGLLSFSRILAWMFKKYHNTTLAILTGFMIGSLNKVWPWKHTVSTRLNSHGEVVPFIQKNISPFNFDGNAHIFLVILLAIIGFTVIFLLEKFANKGLTKESN